MIPTEVTNKTLFSKPAKGRANPTSGQGGDAKCRGRIAVTPQPARDCAGQVREYFNKVKKTPPRRPRGQPPKTQGKSREQPAKMSAPRKKFVAILVSLGFSLRQIARDLRIDHSTISKAAQRDPNFAAALARAKERDRHPQLGFRGWRSAARVIEFVEMGRDR